MNISRLTSADLVRAIGSLSKSVMYGYVNPGTHGSIRIVRVDAPEGPIIVKRFDPAKGETEGASKELSISPAMLRRLAPAFQPGLPVNVDRVLGASYNTRSILESLLAHTPQFYFCYPGRIETINSTVQVKKGHKHLTWLPEEPHELGRISENESNVTISELPSTEVIYEALALPDESHRSGMNIEVQRRHVQIQVALVKIGERLQYKTWIAANDRGITYGKDKLANLPGVIAKLEEQVLVSAYPRVIKAGLLIDCIWFSVDQRRMPAVMEIEHTTGVTSGLARMKGYQDELPPGFPTRYVIVAPDEDRDKVVAEANREQFKELDIWFFPYSAVEELYSLTDRRHIVGIEDDYLETYMEMVMQP